MQIQQQLIVQLESKMCVYWNILITEYFIDYSVGPVTTGYLLGLRRYLVGSHLPNKSIKIVPQIR